MKNVYFKEWYKKNKLISINIDFDKRLLIAYNADFSEEKELVLSKSIDSEFNLIELFEGNKEKGDFIYQVALEGYECKDYLWRREIVYCL